MHRSFTFFLILGVGLSIHIFFYLSAYVTHSLDYFFPGGTIHAYQGIDFFQVPNGMHAFLHGGALTGEGALTSYAYGNTNVYHPFFTQVVGYFFQLFPPQTAFLLWGAIKFFITIGMAILLLLKYWTNKSLPFALLLFFIFFPQYLEIWNGQYHFLLTTSLFYVIYAFLNKQSPFIIGIWYCISLLVKPIGLLWLPLFAIRRQWIVLLTGMGLFVAVSLPYLFNGHGAYYFVNLFERVNNPIGGPPGIFTLDALLRFWQMPTEMVSALRYTTLALLAFIEIKFRPKLLVSFFLWTTSYLLFYDFVFEYHYTILIPIFVFGVMTEKIFQKNFSKILMIITCLPTPFFLMHLLQIETTGALVTDTGWTLLVLFRIIPLLLLGYLMIADLMQKKPTHQ